jgi:hypothetical protein
MTLRRSSAIRKWLLLILAAGLAGCGGPKKPTTHTVSGIVLYKDKPLANVGVTFYPEKGRSATGKTDAEGRFTLTTFGPSDGALPGKHKVAIVPGPGEAANKETTDLTPNDYAPPASGKAAPFPSKYFSRESTNLTVQIPDDLQNGKITLKLLD